MARQQKVGAGGNKRARKKSAFESLKTFKVSKTFLVAERLDLGNVRTYSMCIGYGMPAGDPANKVFTRTQ
jgi:hypothetical protein